MPRKAREKVENAIYHVMIRSISELQLFKNDIDKENFMKLIRYYQTIYMFTVYGFCLMDNHAHLIIYANGADISKIMHGINFRYVIYYNKEYNRHGHLLQDRFKSKIVTDDRYLLTLSAYVHNNALDIPEYKKHPEEYRFSSLGVYIGTKKDEFGIIDEDFIMQMFGGDVKTARENYINLVYRCSDVEFKKEVEFENEKTEYRSERKLIVRNFEPEEVIDFVAKKTNLSKVNIYMKNSRKAVQMRAFSVLLMRCFCNIKCSDICKVLGNITEARVSSLCSKAVETIKQSEKYSNILMEFLKEYEA